MARFQGLINEVEAQGFLSDQTRRNMEETARGLIEKRRADYAVTRGRFEEISKKRGLNSQHVIIRPDHAPGPVPDLDAPPKSGLTPEQRRAEMKRLRESIAGGAK
jgi:hypothetical protein